MYSRRELIRIGAHKAALRCAITERRVRCVAVAVHISRPLVWLNRAQNLLRRVAMFVSFAAVPLGVALFKRTAHDNQGAAR